MMRRLLPMSAAIVLAMTCVSSRSAPLGTEPGGRASSPQAVDKASGSPAFDLSRLPAYQPQQQVSGSIRNFGFGLGGLLKDWEEGFRKFHPDIHFEDKLPTSDAAIPALVTGVTDLAPDGGEATLTETLSFFETYGYYPTDITVASGAYDVEGRSNGLVVYVSKDNPISKLTIEQLDGIFGAQRTGGLRGFKWTLADGRDAHTDIRTWGQLGLKGAWANKPIHTYGHAPSGTSRFFQWKVLKNGDKWNPNYQEFVETGSKMIGDNDRVKQHGGLQYMLADRLANDPYGIAWTVVPQASKVTGIKPVALAPRGGGEFVVPSRASFQSRTYPLVRSIYIYLNRAPGQAVDPKLKEFLRYVLSREGQAAVMNNGNYLPLTAAVVSEQLKKLE
ncbi:Phosphate ABC transporter periplasmic phosphate-binding protein [Paraburkholderia piptadeniae]|uniref:Phosphate ABC transporter periplasmic phosphate-binding protein n=1 Tax=Paraburkholderia piptadeniae TaxID=1701573 RepID=A0A1N7SKH1_9BURK|nr:substrate-binding domain-containing protein [Paraburkholderia piptadeniae]SIT47804.1 Phosphate ABC transporter periplasmic phosphate-binding protein [Paraburkholderia piptadeniae]